MNLYKLILAHLNVNSISNKFDAHLRNVSGQLDLLIISETKINKSFLKSQFLINGFSDPFRIDRNVHREVSKGILCCSYNLHEYNISKHIEILSKNLDLYSSQYESNSIIGDFNVGVSDPHMNDFCNTYNVSSLIKEPTCYKNPENTSCIDLVLINSPRSFKGYCVVETGKQPLRDCLLK